MKKIYGALIDRTMKVIKSNYTKAFKEANIDLTTEQWVIIDSLYFKDGQSQTELAEGNFKNIATVSRIVDLICKKGLTERYRSDSDKRLNKIFITDKGRKLYQKAEPIVVNLRNLGWQGLSDEDYFIFKNIIDRVYWNFNPTEK